MRCHSQDSKAACCHGVLLYSVVPSICCHGVLLMAEAITSQPELHPSLAFWTEQVKNSLTASVFYVRNEINYKSCQDCLVTCRANHIWQKVPTFSWGTPDFKNFLWWEGFLVVFTFAITTSYFLPNVMVGLDLLLLEVTNDCLAIGSRISGHLCCWHTVLTCSISTLLWGTLLFVFA